MELKLKSVTAVDLPTEEDVQREYAKNALRGMLSSCCPDINELLGNNIVFSTRGAVAFCLGQTNFDDLKRAGFDA